MEAIPSNDVFFPVNSGVLVVMAIKQDHKYGTHSSLKYILITSLTAPVRTKTSTLAIWQ